MLVTRLSFILAINLVTCGALFSVTSGSLAMISSTSTPMSELDGQKKGVGSTGHCRGGLIRELSEW